MNEAQIYIDADLMEAEINGRKCLIRTDIDMEQRNEYGITNKKLIKMGRSPISKDNKTIELHHIGQKQNSPLAELTEDEHRSKENYSLLHIVKKQSEIDRIVFRPERKQHWKSRAEFKGW